MSHASPLSIAAAAAGVVAEKADALVSETRSQLIQLQALVTVVLSYQLLFSVDSLVTGEAQRLTILVLMLVCGGLIVLPDAVVIAGWFPAVLALIDTGITTVLVYISGNATSELYLTYFVILLIATTARTKTQLFGFILCVCAIYSLVLVRQFLESGQVSETQMLRIPLFLIMAIFYGDTAARARTFSECDTLTGLPNRRSFMRRLSEVLTRARRDPRGGSILSLDLDGFKLINDTFGPEVGDQVLKAIAGRLKEAVGESAFLARLGSDEFGLILEGISSVEQLRERVQALLRRIARTISVENREIVVTAAVGIAVYPTDGETVKLLMRSADAAMHRAKEQGTNNYEFYAAEMNTRASERFILENNLRKALERREFQVFYQPQVEVATGRITGFEALLRWLHPSLGLVPPLRFIAIAEATGMIVSIGEWVLRTACEQAKTWHDRGFGDLAVTVNLSARQLRQPDLIPMIRRALDETGFPPSLLALELTESSIMHEIDATIDRLLELKALGLRLSIDDFGTGYSALSYLKRFPVDTLKIDQALIRDIASSEEAVAIVAAVITMAQRLRLKVVAEGVETDAQIACLRAQGCQEAQGYVYSHPLPASEIESLLLQWRLIMPSPHILPSPGAGSDQRVS